jgi:hypothetical protein
VSEIGCGIHTAHIYRKGGLIRVMELTPLTKVVWNRIRDDISGANVFVGITPECASELANLKSVVQELHIFRNGVKVWEGPITRLEFRYDTVEVWAQDILWVAKHTALSKGYDQKGTRKAKCGWRMNWLLKDMTYAKDGDPWKVLNRIQWKQGGDEPETTKVVNAWSTTTWDDFDAYAEDGGMDYTVVGRDIYFWDTHFAWRILPDLYDRYLTDEPAIVEYGNEFQTRAIVTDGNGNNGQYTTTDAAILAEYRYVDTIHSAYNEGQSVTTKPTAADIKAWTEQAKTIVNANPKPPLRIRVSENSGLTPEAPYDINDLIPGSWVKVVVERLIKKITGDDVWHKLDTVSVTEEGGKEVVQISTVTAPKNPVWK